MSEWKANSIEVLGEGTPAVSSYFALRVLRNLRNFQKEQSVSCCKSIPLNYWESDLDEANYQGLRIHTSPYFARGIAIPIRREPRKNRVRLIVAGHTTDSIYRGTDTTLVPTAKADFTDPDPKDSAVWLHLQARGDDAPATVSTGLDPQLITPMTEGPATILANHTDPYVLKTWTLEATLPEVWNYSGEGSEVHLLWLWFRSTLSTEVLVSGHNWVYTGMDDRRTGLELPMLWQSTVDETPSEPEPPLAGRLIVPSGRITGVAQGIPNLQPMSPYPVAYFCEQERFEAAENAFYVEPDEMEISPSIPVFFKVLKLVYPMFPQEALDAARPLNPTTFPLNCRVWDVSGFVLSSVYWETYE